ncbi:MULTISPECIES: hypothetical protein [Psychrilyobacter]|uniref:GIY-YIG domain-containing protein n=1 Tax=Psychrilyobacter piezotolerans TaxID=2293438 RepID=A0ABX9KJ93_9FUSO|nr:MULTISPECIES: hypothetical protein [Psychrilyobacter]MCS5421877.1 hypothetical protein [Psychrilyobacter sp. S5]NDI76968.1 hypothetical protein [Psychrilyobacter piezotolerans]RDE64586.1 hypothetical protein DV867_03330 [Psychrilyobacter sp. S5]REI42398.1 hypothetical protein DYH56_03330 [Psychrilyobacter piezotolerans]
MGEIIISINDDYSTTVKGKIEEEISTNTGGLYSIWAEIIDINKFINYWRDREDRYEKLKNQCKEENSSTKTSPKLPKIYSEITKITEKPFLEGTSQIIRDVKIKEKIRITKVSNYTLLYIGEAKDLRDRLKAHMNVSINTAGLKLFGSNNSTETIPLQRITEEEINTLKIDGKVPHIRNIKINYMKVNKEKKARLKLEGQLQHNYNCLIGLKSEKRFNEDMTEIINELGLPTE